MKKPASDQMFHDRRYQERKRAEAAKRPVKKTDEAKTPQDASRKHKGAEEETS